MIFNKTYPLSYLLFLLLLFISANAIISQPAKIYVKKDRHGFTLDINGTDFFIKGMNWNYMPIGKTYTYSLWNQPDEIIKSALDSEMQMLKSIGVNAVRQYTGIPPKWVKYIFEEFGIYTVLNYSFGRYGITFEGDYIQNTNYGDSTSRQFLIAESKSMAEEYKHTPGILMWLLGNENNYGLFWKGAETADIPEGETKESVRARQLYSAFEAAIVEIKKIDKNHPVAICNGDLLFCDIIAEEVKSMDVFGVNIYRGRTFTDAFDVIKEKLDVPVMFTEFGSDAFDAIKMREDQRAQAEYLISNWKDIYENSARMGKAQNCIGGFTFQFSDGWWKYKQDSDLEVHNTHASWSNGGYSFDYVEGKNNMNEEWFGICAKSFPDDRGLYKLQPRAAYFALKRVFQLDVLDDGIDMSDILTHFSTISIPECEAEAAEYKSTIKTRN